MQTYSIFYLWHKFKDSEKDNISGFYLSFHYKFLLAQNASILQAYFLFLVM